AIGGRFGHVRPTQMDFAFVTLRGVLVKVGSGFGGAGRHRASRKMGSILLLGRSPNRRFPLLLPGAARPALSARVTRSVRTLGYAAIANASLSLAFRVFETFNGLFMPGKSSRLSTHVDPGSAPHPFDNKGLWWSRRVLPPGPLHLFHDAVYRHRRAEARRAQCRRFRPAPQGSRDSAPARRR
ncbi:MAG: hypothetical protein RL490_1852, partial [Pseudomonadota bacterium]